jgi:glycerate-2-kinase
VLDVFAAALAAVDPEQAVRTELEQRPFPGPLTVVAIGKAAAAMARGVPGATGGIVVSDHIEAVPDGFTSYLGGHPLPDQQSEAAGTAVLDAVDSATGPILFLISGGSSALCEVPAAGMSIADTAAVTSILLRSGADIAELNTVRKHLSSLKGGRLAERAGSSPARTLLVSDVVGDRLDTIGSGPTVPDPTTYGDALEILDRRGVRAPGTVTEFLVAGAEGRRSETPKSPFPGHEVALVANAAVAAGAAVRAARDQGIPARIETTELVGDAETAAAGAVAAVEDSGMTFFAGETTVEVTGGGVGGRNQHAALAAALVLDGGDDGVRFGALATDGVDGPTDAAGAVVDAGSIRRGREAGLDPIAYFHNHASHPLLEASGDLLRTGPTGTNVGDLWVVWRP